MTLYPLKFAGILENFPIILKRRSSPSGCGRQDPAGRL